MNIKKTHVMTWHNPRPQRRRRMWRETPRDMIEGRWVSQNAGIGRLALLDPFSFLH
jgi:hypothetical protein